MKKKQSIFSQSYKVGVAIFVGLTLIVSFTLFSIFRVLDSTILKKDNTKTEEIPENVEYVHDTIYKDKPVTVIDTFYVPCRKKHCDEIHVVTKDTIK